jgi:hypothetical protein
MVLVLRKSYFRKSPTTGKSVFVPVTSFRRVGTGRGRGVSNPHARFSRAKGYRSWITRKGKLGGPGYLHKPPSTRHELLSKCVHKHGYRSCLGSVMVLERPRATSFGNRAKLAADRHFLTHKFGSGRMGGSADATRGPRVRNPFTGRSIRIGGAVYRRVFPEK